LSQTVVVAQGNVRKGIVGRFDGTIDFDCIRTKMDHFEHHFPVCLLCCLKMNKLILIMYLFFVENERFWIKSNRSILTGTTERWKNLARIKFRAKEREGLSEQWSRIRWWAGKQTTNSQTNSTGRKRCCCIYEYFLDFFKNCTGKSKFIGVISLTVWFFDDKIEINFVYCWNL